MLEIPADAKRTATPIGRKCRAEFVKTLAVIDRAEGEHPKGHGRHNHNTVYSVGEITKPDTYDDDFRLECTNGIHFFLTRAEAEEY